MVGRAVDVAPEHVRDAIVAVVNGNGPHVHENEQTQVGDFVQREDERVDVIGYALQEAVDGMEGVAGERGGHLPAMVLLVEARVDATMVEQTVNPVDARIGENDERDDTGRQINQTCKCAKC